MAKLRTFIAVDLPGEVVSRAQRLGRELGEGADGIKWVEPQSMHLTLKFLGDVRENETYEICQAIDRAVKPLAAFDVDCRGAGAFPNLERPRTLWIGVGQESEPLAHLHAAIEDAMADLGFHREPKRFRPHLTIGRVKRPGPISRKSAAGSPSGPTSTLAWRRLTKWCCTPASFRPQARSTRRSDARPSSSTGETPVPLV